MLIKAYIFFLSTRSIWNVLGRNHRAELETIYCSIINSNWLAHKQGIFWPFSLYRISPKHRSFKHASNLGIKSEQICLQFRVTVAKGDSEGRVSQFFQLLPFLEFLIFTNLKIDKCTSEINTYEI